MTFEERVIAIRAFGLTPRQARFVATVALNGGYCLRRQYDAFAGIRYGKNVRAFLDGLVRRGIAQRFQARADRGHIYHLHARALYRALHLDESRYWRDTSAAQMARRLMVLDYVLSRPDVAWYTTEEHKVELFTMRGVPGDALPRRVFGPREGTSPSRLFPHQWPVFIAEPSPVVHFVYLAMEGAGDGLNTFLRDHAALLRHLASWAVVAIGRTVPASLHASFAEFLSSRLHGPATNQDLLWYFERRQRVERGDWANVPVADLRHFRDVGKRLATPATERLYASWQRTGALSSPEDGDPSSASSSTGRLVIDTLPFAYEQFGSLPGVA
jgi:hypothetical protein